MSLLLTGGANVKAVDLGTRGLLRRRLGYAMGVVALSPSVPNLGILCWISAEQTGFLQNPTQAYLKAIRLLETHNIMPIATRETEIFRRDAKGNHSIVTPAEREKLIAVSNHMECTLRKTRLTYISHTYLTLPHG